MSNAEVLQEELEVLESIFPDELESEYSQSSVTDQADPFVAQSCQTRSCAYEWTRSSRYQDRSVSSAALFPFRRLMSPCLVSTWLHVVYTPDYPETLPNLRLEPIEGELTGEETDELIHGMGAIGTESLGMAMVFTMVSYLREHLVEVLESRNRRIQEEENRRYAEMEEKEAARKRGTPVTRESFTALMQKLKQRALEAKKKAEEDRVKSLPPKEREEYRKISARPSGKLSLD